MKHIVAQGECLASIAKKYGFLDWQVIYNDSQNVSLRQTRPNPNVLCPGDEVFIPDKKLKEENCGSGQTLSFTLSTKSGKTFLRIILQNPDGSLLNNTKYALNVDNEIFEGTTNSDGLIEQEILADAESGELSVWSDPEDDSPITCELAIGHLDPVDEVSGVKSRLNNLGFTCGSEDDSIDQLTRTALKEFQKAFGLNVTGDIDGSTKAKLVELHDNN